MTLVSMALAVVPGALLAACGSGAQAPEGLSGQQTGGSASGQYSTENRQATVLTPRAGSCLAGKTTVTLGRPRRWS